MWSGGTGRIQPLSAAWARTCPYGHSICWRCRERRRPCAVPRRVRAIVLAFLLSASLAHADTTIPPASTAAPELAAAVARLSFEPGRSTLRKEALSAVDALAAWLRAHPAAQIEIGVHTDDRGATEWNLRLSQARADAVRDALVERKVAGERLAARGYGETQPIAPNTTEEGRRRNRRVEVHVMAVAR